MIEDVTRTRGVRGNETPKKDDPRRTDYILVGQPKSSGNGIGTRASSENADVGNAYASVKLSSHIGFL